MQQPAARKNMRHRLHITNKSYFTGRREEHQTNLRKAHARTRACTHTYTESQEPRVMDRCAYGSIAQRSFHKRLCTEGNVYLVKDRKEQTEANCAMIHHRPTYDIAQRNLIQR